MRFFFSWVMAGRMPKLLLLFVFASVFDLAGLGLIGPYIAIITDPDSLSKFRTHSLEGLPLVSSTSSQELVIFLSFFLLGIFSFKAIMSVWINYTIVRFSAARQTDLRARLMALYQSLPYTEFTQRNSSEYIHNTQTLVTQFSTAIVTGGMSG